MGHGNPRCIGTLPRYSRRRWTLISVTVFDDVWLIPSFWLQGFQDLHAAGKIRLRWSHGIRSPISPSASKWKSVAFTVAADNRERLGYIDIFDSFRSFDEATLERVDLYFKFNFNEAQIQTLAPSHQKKVRPTGFYFPVALESLPRLPAALLRAAESGFFARRGSLSERIRNARRSAKQRYELDTRYSSIDRYRNDLATVTVRDLDVFWNVGYWPPRFDAEERKSTQRIEVMKILDRIQRSTSYIMQFGFVDKPDARAAVPSYVLAPSPTTREYLEILSRTKLSIATRGLEDCFSWRVGEHLALQRFVLLEKFYNTPRVPLRDGHDAVFFESDLSDLEEKIRWYLDHDAEREVIAQRGGSYFDLHCRPERQIDAMITELLAS